MNPNPNRVESIFAAAVAQPAEARAAYLDQACGGDAELRKRVEALLTAHQQAAEQSFLTGAYPSALDPDSLSERPGTRIGPYKLLQQIGEGGMGVVYMAEQEQPVRRRVALKIIKPGMDSAQVIARFEAERQALAMMDHPNIARVLDAGTTDSGRPYFVMELVYGVPIAKFCDDSQLTPRQRLELFVPICQAIQHAHQKGIIHRDIKPSNVLVTMHDDKAVPKVIDFGVAKAVEQRLTERSLFTAFGAVVGTLEYMSPEQAEMNAFGVDTRSDVYSLGVLLYELLTGTTPLERKRLREAAYTEVLRLIKEVEPPRPSVRLSSSGDLPKIAAARKTEPTKLSRLLRGEIDWIVMRCLEKDRTRRYESASALARDVERYLRDEAVEACPPSVGYRLRKFTRKYRVLLSTAAAFAALLMIASGVSTWLAVAARQAESVVNEKREEAAGERDRAQKEWQRAEDAANHAKANAAETGRALDRMTVAKGIQLAEEGKFFAALPQFIKPLERGGLSPEEEKVHRMRIASYLRYAPGRPRLRHIFFCDKSLSRRAWPSPTIAFSADGKRLLAVAEDVVHLWDLHRGNLLATLKHPNSVRTAQFIPDGTRILTATWGDATVWMWDATSGRRLDPPVVDWGGLLQRPTALLPSSPWQFIVSAGAKPWEYLGWMDPYRSVGETEISRDGRRALFSFAKRSRLLDLQTHKLVGQGSYPDSRAWSPDFRFFLQRDGNLVKIHDTTRGKNVSQLIDHGSPVQDFEFSSDGNRVLTVGEDGFVRVWDVHTGRPCARVRLTGAMGSLGKRFCFSPDNRFLAGWSPLFGELAWWVVETGKLVREFPQKGLYEDQYIGWRADGKQLLWVFPATPNVVTLLDAASNWEPELVLPQRGVVEAVYAPDGRTLATGGRDGVIRIWDLCNQHDVVKWQAPETNDFNTDIRLRQDYSRFTWRLDGKRTFEVKTVAGSQKFSWLDPQQSLPPGTSFSVGTISPDQSRAITFHSGPHYRSDRILKLWDTNARRMVGKPLELTVGDPPNLGLPSFATCVAFSPDSRLFVIASDTVLRESSWTAHGKAQLYDARTGDVVGEPLKHDGPVLFAAFSPDGEVLVTCGGDATARLWRTKTGEPASANLRHGDMVTCAAFAPNGKTMATGSRDGTVRIWEVSSGRLAGGLAVNNGSPWNLAFHPSEPLILVSYTDLKDPNYSPAGKIQIFDIPSYQAAGPAVREQDGPDRHQFRIRKDGRFALGLFDRRTWNPTPDKRSVSDLTKLGQLYSGLRSDSTDGASPLNKQELQALWRELSAKYPEEFAASPKAAVEWRIEQLQSASKINRPDLVAFHRRWLAAELAEAAWQPGERGNEDMERDHYLQRLYALALYGRHAEAIAAADSLAAGWPKDSDTLYSCACIHALAAGTVKSDAAFAERYAARAVALLRQAVKAGYNDGQHIRKDPDLDALRSRKDFLQFQRDLPGTR